MIISSNFFLLICVILPEKKGNISDLSFKNIYLMLLTGVLADREGLLEWMVKEGEEYQLQQRALYFVPWTLSCCISPLHELWLETDYIKAAVMGQSEFNMRHEWIWVRQSADPNVHYILCVPWTCLCSGRLPIAHSHRHEPKSAFFKLQKALVPLIAGQ